jgi:hypothetical protein
MSPDEPGDGLPVSARSPAATVRLRLRWLVIVVVAMIVLTAGWPLVNLIVSDRHHLRPGTSLTVGPGHGKTGTITVARPGWTLLSAETNPLYSYTLKRGHVRMTIDYVQASGADTDAQLLAGLRKLLRVTHPGVQAGRTFNLPTRPGRTGLATLLAGANQIGVASIFAASGRHFAIEMIMLAPEHVHHRLFVPGLQIMRSLRFGRSTS